MDICPTANSNRQASLSRSSCRIRRVTRRLSRPNNCRPNGPGLKLYQREMLSVSSKTVMSFKTRTVIKFWQRRRKSVSTRSDTQGPTWLPKPCQTAKHQSPLESHRVSMTKLGSRKLTNPLMQPTATRCPWILIRHTRHLFPSRTAALFPRTSSTAYLWLPTHRKNWIVVTNQNQCLM